MKTFLLTALCALSCFASFSAEEKPPTADELLAGVRYSTAYQKNQKVNGHLRKKSEKIPFGIEIKDGNIFFNYALDGSQWTTFELKFKEKGQELYTYENGKSKKFETNRYGERIGNTDISFEDLSFRFLYWPNGKILPHDHTAFIKGRRCYIVDVPNPNPKSGQYAFIRVWIDTEQNVLWQIDAFNAEGKHLKRFSITSVMKTDNSWFFKQMRIETRDPNNPKKTTGVNYIEMEAN